MAYKPFKVDKDLSWEEKKQKYKAAANKFKKANPDKDLKAFYTKHGQLTQPDGTSLQLKNKANTGQPPDFQPKPKATHQASANKRNFHLKISNEHLSKEELAAWEKNRKELNKQKLQADHVREVQETGPEIETLRKWRKKGLITEKEFQEGLKKIRKVGSGSDIKKNLQPLTGKENSVKQEQVGSKNKSLEKLERRNLSDRLKIGPFKGKTFGQIFAFDKGNSKQNYQMKINPDGTTALTKSRNFNLPRIDPNNPLLKLAGLNPLGQGISTVNHLLKIGSGEGFIDMAKREIEAQQNANIAFNDAKYFNSLIKEEAEKAYRKNNPEGWENREFNEYFNKNGNKKNLISKLKIKLNGNKKKLEA
jgi:hypothetical protein